jgi:Predicted GTPases
MAGVKDLYNTWKNLKEVDLRPIRESALTPVKLAIVGRPGVGRHTLAEQMRCDPQRPQSKTQTALLISDLNLPDRANAADLIILMLDATAKDFSQERALAKKWSEAGKKVLAFVNKIDLLGDQPLASNSEGWPMERVLHGSILAPAFMQREFVQVIMELLPERHLALGRQFPLFRVAIAQQLINESCFTNAVYSFSTGIAEVVPIFDIPLNITDTIVLTKAQAFLVYKLGLTLGFSIRWQDYLGEFGSVIGGGFLWRQLARMLIGLIPIWGIVPKVAVAYSGTYVVGHVVLQWYLTGRKITKQQMGALYTNALLNGKKMAQSMLARLPRPRLGLRKKPLPPALITKNCPFCMKPNAPDANFCQYCGQTFQPKLSEL